MTAASACRNTERDAAEGVRERRNGRRQPYAQAKRTNAKAVLYFLAQGKGAPSDADDSENSTSHSAAVAALRDAAEA